jgi:hypothetical protein
MLPGFMPLAVVSLLIYSSAAAKERVNVLFFAVDDLCGWVDAMGYDQAITPKVDSLAHSGMH